MLIVECGCIDPNRDDSAIINNPNRHVCGGVFRYFFISIRLSRP